MYEIVCQTLREIAAAGMLPSHLVAQDMNPDMCLSDLGIDSLGAMTLFSEIAGRLSISEFDLELDQSKTLGEISAALDEIMSDNAA